MKNLIISLIILVASFSNVRSQDIDSTSRISKNEVSVAIVDNRIDPTVIGDLPIDIFIVQAMNPRKKVKDKKGVSFPLFTDLSNKALQDKGFMSTKISDYTITVALDELYYKSEDKFTYREITQNCFITVRVLKSGTQNPLYEKKYSGLYRSSIADLKRIGYKVDNNFLFLSVSINDALKQVSEDEELQKLFGT